MDWFVVDAMRNLAMHGYGVTLVCDMDEDFVERNSDYATCVDMEMKRGISAGDLFTKPFKLRKFFSKENFDAVYYMSPNASLYASFGAKLAGVPVRIYCQAGLRYVSLSGIGRGIFKLIEKATCFLSTHVRAVSPKNRQFAIEEGLCPADKIAVVGEGGTTGVDIAACDSFDHKLARAELRNYYEVPPNAFVYGFVGRLNADKGVGELIEAFETVKNSNSDAFLVLVGMEDESNPVRSDLVARAKASKSVLFTGNVSPDEVYRHMAMFDVLVHPTYREGFGKVLQEAMGMRLPIVTTNVPGPSEVIEDDISGILVPPRDCEALACEMSRLRMDGALRDRLSRAGRLRAERYFDRPVMLANQLADMDGIMQGRGNAKR